MRYYVVNQESIPQSPGGELRREGAGASLELRISQALLEDLGGPAPLLYPD